METPEIKKFIEVKADFINTLSITDSLSEGSLKEICDEYCTLKQPHQEGKSIGDCKDEVARKTQSKILANQFYNNWENILADFLRGYIAPKDFLELENEVILHYAQSRPQTLPSDEERDVKAKEFGTRKIGRAQWEQEQIGNAVECFKAGWNMLKSQLSQSKQVEKKEGEKDKLIYSWKDIYRAIQNDRKELRQTDCFQVPILPKIVINTKPIDV